MDPSPTDVLYAYQQGVFPMADPGADDALVWVRPDPRGILPLEDFHVPTNLQKLVDRGTFTVRTDTAFAEVIAACADRSSTWLSCELQALFRTLHHRGYAHSVEAYYEGALAGGLYGLALGGAFFGESMFYREDNASKVALVHLVEQLKAGGFILLDIQWATDHLRQFGAVEIPRLAYERRLQSALLTEATWWPQRNGRPS
ncbi:MAG: leucyl/phenylalanyl-tRNA--protein transferase [Bacteroidetes bacterium]|jgi:leucyl/phenylalanyl-tRNA--protein transferase|nr:leucyl/phenylalanyl-tRNA--protein transferase [Bacteroidota bacterium]